ncbi:MAG TPA: metallophosphoesterase [Methylotenera sp.]|jgi:predicted phosphodiesterase
MKIHVLSDLHIEFSAYNIQVLNADVIVLAGDIGVGIKGIEYAMQLLEITKSKILYVMGNHEAYHHNIDTIRRTLRQLCSPEKAFEVEQRLFFLDCDEIVIDDVRFLGTTMWTDFRLFGEAKRFECLAEARWLNDFRIIRCGNGDVFRPRDSVELHEQSLEWLTRKLDKPFNGKTVVITHHLPSFESVVERYKDDLLSACFASNLDHLFGKMDLWIHGHTHDSLDYVKNGTKVICNPRGYSQYEGDVENYSFDPKLVIEI